MLESFRPKGEVLRIPLKNGLDNILSGGLETKTVNMIYGPPASGKTNLCLLAAVRCVETGRKAIFIDTEGGHSVERLRQIAGPESDAVMDNIYFYEPSSFQDQQFIIENLKAVMEEDVGLIILDSAVAFYRYERCDENAQELNRALSSQVSRLSSLARRNNLSVILTTQVYSSFENEGEVEPVGGSTLKYGSKVIIELKRDGPYIDALLVRHRELPGGLSTRFRIVDKGIETVKDAK